MPRTKGAKRGRPTPDLDLPFNYHYHNENSPRFQTFAKRQVNPGRPIHPDHVDHFRDYHFLEEITNQGWLNFFSTGRVSYPRLVRLFYANLHTVDHSDGLTYLVTKIDHLVITLSIPRLAAYLDMPFEGTLLTPISRVWIKEPISPLDQCRTVLGNPAIDFPTVPKSATYLSPKLRFLHHFIGNNVFPRIGHRADVSLLDMAFLAHLVTSTPVNLPHLFLRGMVYCATKQSGTLLYGNIITHILSILQFPVDDDEVILNVPDGSRFYTAESLATMNFIVHHGEYVYQRGKGHYIAPGTGEAETESEASEEGEDTESAGPAVGEPSHVAGEPSSAAPTADIPCSMDEMYSAFREFEQNSYSRWLQVDTQIAQLQSTQQSLQTSQQEIQATQQEMLATQRDILEQLRRLGTRD